MKADCDAIKQEINEINAEMNVLRKSGPNGSDNRITALRGYMEEEKVKLAEATAARDEIAKELEKAGKTQNTQVAKLKQINKIHKYKTAAEIDAKIRKLEAKVVNAANIAAEKTILKKITHLNTSKQTIGQIAQIQQSATEIRGSVNEVRGRFREASNLVNMKEKRIVKLTEDIANALQSKTTNEAKLSEVKIQIDLKEAQVAKLFAHQKKIRDDYYQTLREATRSEEKLEQAKNQEEYRQRQAKRDEARLRNEARQAEYLAQVPWELEMASCDSLISYLRTLLPTSSAPASAVTTPAVVLPGEVQDGRDTLKCLVRVDEDKDYMFGTSTGRRNNRNKRAAPKEVPVDSKLKLAPQTIARFLQFELTPPVSADEVAESIAQVEAKKEMFKTLPRDAPNPVKGLSNAGGGAQSSSRGRGRGRGGAGRGRGNNSYTNYNGDAHNGTDDAEQADVEEGELASPSRPRGGKPSQAAFIACSDDFPTMGLGDAAESTASAVAPVVVPTVWGKPSSAWGTPA